MTSRIAAPLLARVVPDDIVVEEFRTDPDGIVLHPAEEALIARSVPARRREFTTGRHCAHRALERLGLPAPAILPDPKGSPHWPTGVVGSITHCAGYRAAAVAGTARVRSLGIDATPNDPLPEGVLEAIGLSAEQRRVQKYLAAHPSVRWDRVLFSAKESVYKTWYPLVRRSLGFEEADVDFRPDTEFRPGPDAAGEGSFTARILPPVRELGFPQELSGRYAVRDGLVLTAITLRS
ncbi:4'-phosphopantetheinyl transferase [Streptomyces sp. NPDC058257]|uniref:4'-phosphopantetheinyl transferase family protein n=1 Tax=Streptomyces sp. NPDC058257 TaxID=3346409 RepID=UPI0036E7A301